MVAAFVIVRVAVAVAVALVEVVILVVIVMVVITIITNSKLFSNTPLLKKLPNFREPKCISSPSQQTTFGVSYVK
jgi:hypothetical protein